MLPPGREVMVILGISEMTILKFTVALPASFVATTVKLNVPAAVGIPDIVPLDVFKLMPVGSVPLVIDHVIGTIPIAASF